MDSYNTMVCGIIGWSNVWNTQRVINTGCSMEAPQRPARLGLGDAVARHGKGAGGCDPDAASALTADLAEAPSNSSLEVLSHLQQGADPDKNPPDESMPHTVRS